MIPFNCVYVHNPGTREAPRIFRATSIRHLVRQLANYYHLPMKYNPNPDYIPTPGVVVEVNIPDLTEIDRLNGRRYPEGADDFVIITRLRHDPQLPLPI